MGEEDLGLSLSLGFPHGAAFHRQTVSSNLQLNLMMPCLLPSSCSSASGFLPHKSSSSVEAFCSSDADRNSEMRTFLRGIDVNRLPSVSMGDCEDEVGVSSPNSTISTVSGKRGDREANGEDLENERASSHGMSDEEDGDNCRKKLRLSKDQSAVLEESFREHNTLNPKQKLALAKQLGLRPRQVEVWFQNRRARTKLKQTEVDCEFLKRCCENLTEENRRLQKEVQELRALKLSPQFYMHMAPPTTLTMCPACERVAVPHPAASAADHAMPIAMGPARARPVSISPWAPPAGPVAHAPFDAVRPRS